MEPVVEGLVVDGRSCKGCTMCCKIVGIRELDKPPGVWCPHCSAKRGCKIYDTRPGECRGFYCGYLMMAELDERWNPSKCKIVVTYDEVRAARLTVYVDQSRASVWRQEPYYSQIKRWARAAAAVQGQVMVWEGPKAIVVLPDGERDLGNLKPGQLIFISQKMGPDGPRFDAEAVDPDDPRARNAPITLQAEPRPAPDRRSCNDR
jgi:hypothetical protein